MYISYVQSRSFRKDKVAAKHRVIIVGMVTRQIFIDEQVNRIEVWFFNF